MFKEYADTIPFDQCSNTIYVLSSFHEKHMFHHYFLTTQHGQDANFSVKDHVLTTKEFCVILRSNALVQWVSLCKKASNHHANLPLEMSSFTL